VGGVANWKSNYRHSRAHWPVLVICLWTLCLRHLGCGSQIKLATSGLGVGHLDLRYKHLYDVVHQEALAKVVVARIGTSSSTISYTVPIMTVMYSPFGRPTRKTLRAARDTSASLDY
jgi:hypothetical protein